MPFDNEPKNWAALLIGLAVLALGLIPLLNQWGVIGFNLPGFLTSLIGTIGLWIIAGIGLYLLITSFLEDDMMRIVSIIVAGIVLLLGLIPLLHQFNVIGFGLGFITVTWYYILFAIEGILEEFTADAPIVENGELKMVPARSGKEIIDFFPPAGKTEVAVTKHSEARVFYNSYKDKGLKEASWKIGFEPEFVQKVEFLTDLGFASDVPIDFNGNKVSPKQMIMHLLNNQKPETKKPTDFRGHMMVIVKGFEGDKKVEYKIIEYATDELTRKMQKKGCQGSYRTGIYGGIGALMLARNEITKKGVFYSNSAVDPTAFLKEADKVGIEITISRSERI